MKHSMIEIAALALPDSAVDRQEDIQMIRISLANMNTAHAAAVKSVQDVDCELDELRTEADAYKRNIGELEQIMADAATGCMLQDPDSLKTWLDAEKGIEDARRSLRQYDLGLPGYERWLRAQKGPLNVLDLATRIGNLEMELAKARHDAKVTMAHAQAAQ